MTGTVRKIPTGLNEFQVFRLFKCAVKDDETLIVGMLPQGYLLALAVKASDAVRVITSGITAYRSTGSTNFMPLNLSYSAKTNSELGPWISRVPS